MARLCARPAVFARPWATRPRRARRGVAVLEVVLVLPVLVILLMAIVEFGLILANLKQVAVASRVGSLRASQTAGLPSAGPVPADIVAAVQQQLESSGITACQVILEHNTNGSTDILTNDMGCDCNPLAAAPIPPGTYVRLTVCVQLTELAPNLLATFGFDTSTRMAEHTTTFRYEL
jgi:Flp pilus assembly protein TadG